MKTQILSTMLILSLSATAFASGSHSDDHSNHGANKSEKTTHGHADGEKHEHSDEHDHSKHHEDDENYDHSKHHENHENGAENQDAEDVVYTKGVVKKIDPKTGKVTLIHEELPTLGMPAMTMVFRLSEDVDASTLDAGKEIEFSAERINGKLTVTDIKE